MCSTVAYFHVSNQRNTTCWTDGFIASTHEIQGLLVTNSFLSFTSAFSRAILICFLASSANNWVWQIMDETRVAMATSTDVTEACSSCFGCRTSRNKVKQIIILFTTICEPPNYSNFPEIACSITITYITSKTKN